MDVLLQKEGGHALEVLRPVADIKFRLSPAVRRGPKLPGGKQALELKGGLLPGGNQGHPGPADGGNDLLQQRVVGAAQNQGVRPPLQQGR